MRKIAGYLTKNRSEKDQKIAQNVVNIAASLFFVFACDMKGTGVTLETLIAQNACPQLANPATLKMKIYFVCRCSIYS